MSFYAEPLSNERVTFLVLTHRITGLSPAVKGAVLASVSKNLTSAAS